MNKLHFGRVIYGETPQHRNIVGVGPSFTRTYVSDLYRPMLLLHNTTNLQPDFCMNSVYQYEASQ